MPASTSRFVLLTLLLLVASLGGILANCGRIVRPANEATVRAALLQSLGLSSLAISADCTASRSLVEGVCGCLSDVPGGYCYHSSCDIVGAPKAQAAHVYSIKVEN